MWFVCVSWGRALKRRSLVFDPIVRTTWLAAFLLASCGRGAFLPAGEDDAPRCSDGVQNGDETDIDCGGSCPPCGSGSSCSIPWDCESGVCAGNVCHAPTCSDRTWSAWSPLRSCRRSCGRCRTMSCTRTPGRQRERSARPRAFPQLPHMQQTDGSKSVPPRAPRG